MPLSKSFVYNAELTAAEKVTRLAETDLSAQSCKARNGNCRCILDKIHQLLGTSHIHRDIEGSLVSFRADTK